MSEENKDLTTQDGFLNVLVVQFLTLVEGDEELNQKSIGGALKEIGTHTMSIFTKGVERANFKELQCKIDRSRNNINYLKGVEEGIKKTVYHFLTIKDQLWQERKELLEGKENGVSE